MLDHTAFNYDLNHSDLLSTLDAMNFQNWEFFLICYTKTETVQQTHLVTFGSKTAINFEQLPITQDCNFCYKKLAYCTRILYGV